MSNSQPKGPKLDRLGPWQLPRRQIYESAQLSLVPLDADAHSAELFAGSHSHPDDAALWTYMFYGPFEDEAAMHAWAEGCQQSSDTFFFAVIDAASAKAVGVVSFLNMVPAAGRLELGHIWYVPSFQRGTSNTCAMHLMLSEAFDAQGYRRVEWKCDSLNARSRAAALRLGFQYEGLFRQHVVVKGHNRDTAWYSMLDSEWPSVKAGMQRWLAWQSSNRPSLSALISAAQQT